MDRKTAPKWSALKIAGAVVIITLVVIVVSAGLGWNKFFNKNNLIAKYETLAGQELWLLGTFHHRHFKKSANYSLQDLLNVVKNVQPDLVLLEAREEYFRDYGVLDGPIDIAVAYSYCLEHAIPVGLIDWWVVDNEFQTDSIDTRRDEQMFANINEELQSVPAETKVLVICGAVHFQEQTRRFAKSGAEKQRISRRAAYFNGDDGEFKYPAGVVDVWERCSYFYAYTYPAIIAEDPDLDPEIKSLFTEGDQDAFYRQQTAYCELLRNNQLYE